MPTKTTVRESSRDYRFCFDIRTVDYTNLPYTEASALVRELAMQLKQKGFQVQFKLTDTEDA